MDRSPSISEPAFERALLAGAHPRDEPAWAAKDSVDELAELATTAGVTTVGRFVCRLRKVSPATYLGRGKCEELRDLAASLAADVILFDEDLSPAQGRNVEDIVGRRVIDRTQVILDIFARRAHTSEGRLQIELAQLEYILPRLRHMWTHLERQKGGIGLRGPGEQQLELDRRRIETRIVRIRREIEQVRSRRAELRRGRRRHGWALVCLVGYTNAGKSTLLNALSGSRVYADDKLFATLDPTTRRIDLPNHQPALLTDTVGFIRKLPHNLVDAFKATIEEAAVADLLVHVMDASHPQVRMQADAVRRVLAEIVAAERPVIDVLNKVDRPEGAHQAGRLEPHCHRPVAISALTGDGLDALRAEIADCLRDRSVPFAARVPLGEGRIQALIRQGASIESERFTDRAWCVEGRMPSRLAGQIAPYLAEQTRSTEPE